MTVSSRNTCSWSTPLIGFGNGATSTCRKLSLKRDLFWLLCVVSMNTLLPLAPTNNASSIPGDASRNIPTVAPDVSSEILTLRMNSAARSSLLRTTRSPHFSAVSLGVVAGCSVTRRPLSSGGART